MVTKPQTYNSDLANLPPALLPLVTEPRWVTWRWVSRVDQDGTVKWTKVPHNPKYYNCLAKANSPETWGTHAEAWEVFAEGHADGIGFQLLDCDIAALDLDHCVNPETGTIDPWAAEIVNEATKAGAYVEITVSGTGLRVLGRANGDDRAIHRKHAIDRTKGAALEVYHNAARYILVTGWELGECKALPATDFFHRIHDRYDAPKPEPEISGLDFNTAPKQSEDVELIIMYGAPEGTRSEAFQSTVWSLAAAGYSLDDIEAKLRQHPGGIASKYLSPIDRLSQEIERSFNKWKRAQSSSGGQENAKTGEEPDTDPKRENLLLASWLKRPLPPRDYLLGDLLCTTSRWLIVGATGIGKTLFAFELIACAADADKFLDWQGHRKVRVIYIDGEMPAETFKERMELIAERHGDNLEIYGYNRDQLGDEREIPPLDTDAGRKWLKREIEIIKPDLIVFDSIMCLLAGDIMKPEGWAPMLGVMRGLTSMRIAQIWLHHANEGGKAFGDKTRTWQMDTVLSLKKIEDDDTAFLMEFEKARLRTPANREQFKSLIVYPSEGWRFEPASKTANSGKQSQVDIVRGEFFNAYDRLADGMPKSHGFDGKLVVKVSTDAIRDELKSRGFLDKDDKGAITHASRTMLGAAKSLLLKSGKLVEEHGLIWRP